jgi:TolB-like protein
MPDQKHQLAAIMFTDIVGYSSLLNEDENKAFDKLRKNQQIHKRLIKRYRGRWLKEMGDGILVSFHSNIEAVMCALALQKASEELGIALRIGIHQGDVIFENNDVLGDGVNIASRIQGVTSKNDIVISGKVYSDIKNKEGLEAEFLGEYNLKGLSTTTGIYKVSSQDTSLIDYSVDTGELVNPLKIGRRSIILGILIIALVSYLLYYYLPGLNDTSTGTKKGLIVLPFVNYTGTDTTGYFVDGMHSQLIGDIGKVSAIKVISKTTARAYKEKSIPEITAELGINTIIEGAVLCIGDSVCLQITVKNADEKGEPAWVQDFYVERSQILNLYTKVTKEISDEIKVKLTSQEKDLLAQSRTVDPDAYDAYLRGLVHWDQLSEESLHKALEYFNLAIEKDPDWAPPYAGLARVWAGLQQFSWALPQVARPKIYENLNTALTLDLNSEEAHYNSALIAVWAEWNWKKGEREFLKTIELNPSNAYAQIYYAHLLMILRRMDEAKYRADLALELDPEQPLVLGLYCQVMWRLEEWKSMIDLGEKALKIDPNNYFAYGNFVRGYLGMGEYDKWIESMKPMNIWDEETLSSLEKTLKEHGYVATKNQMIDIVEKNFKENGPLYYQMAWLAIDYIDIGEFNKAVEIMEIMYENRDPGVTYLTTWGGYEQMKDNPRYIALLKRMKLPLP